MLPPTNNPPPYTATDPYERARILYQHHDSEYPNDLICYDCGVYHPRLTDKKADLYTYPVKCRIAKRATSRVYFTLHRTQLSAIVVLRIPVPWLHVHQSMRALRLSPQYGTPMLDQYRSGRVWHMRVFWQADSKAVLVDDRMLLRIRAFKEISHIQRQNPKYFPVSGAEFACPHARETYLYERQLGDEIMQACRTLCSNPEKRQRFVHQRRRCTRCPSEYVIEVIPREEFEARDRLTLRKDTHRWVLCTYRYIDFGLCHSPVEREWRALSTWPEARPKGDWGPKQGLDGKGMEVDLTHMELISARFESVLQKTAPLAG